ncbi:hypothetical protein WME90_05645 [Sorangium sp. So ce375]|uniref:hypothetical protein n=1 Tax=Sorangium sp. So ce375 TaxID=3133306 RepID=UPI003F5C12A3
MEPAAAPQRCLDIQLAARIAGRGEREAAVRRDELLADLEDLRCLIRELLPQVVAGGLLGAAAGAARRQRPAYEPRP